MPASDTLTLTIDAPDDNARERAALALSLDIRDLGMSVTPKTTATPDGAKSADGTLAALVVGVVVGAVPALIALIGEWRKAHAEQSVTITLPTGASVTIPRDMSPAELDAYVAVVRDAFKAK